MVYINMPLLMHIDEEFQRIDKTNASGKNFEDTANGSSLNWRSLKEKSTKVAAELMTSPWGRRAH